MADKSKRVINRYFCAILYEEDSKFKEYFKNISESYEEVTYIIHDKDTNEDGTIKKPHMHILFKVGNNARHLSSIAKEIGIAENYLQGCNKKAMLMYLIHLKNEDKTQYRIEEVKGYLKEELKRIVNKQRPEEDRYKELIENILNHKINNTTQMIQYGIKYGILEDIRKSQYILCKIIEENKITIDKKLHKM